MAEWLNDAGWYWISAGLVMIAAEALGASGFLLGAAVSALLVGVLAFLMPAMGWQEQFVAFAIFAGFFTWVYWRRFRAFNEKTDKPKLNHRLLQMVGTTHVLDTPIEEGVGKVQAGDTLWKVQCKQANLPAGTRVKVVAVNGMFLIVEALP
ncbi:protein of unknown function DUF107 [gamma proteobacterium HdN1]|nr:protein of unknown function DUF107 [gamma proteobacterium HdN1]